MGRELIAGWRAFECYDCEHTWEEKTRDFASPSGATCPECCGWEFPSRSWPDESLKTDAHGNLIGQ